jgi:hypothetical protein
VGLLAGELGSNGCNQSNFHFPARPETVPHMQLPGARFPGIDSLGIDPAIMAAIMSAIVAAVFAAVIIGIVLMYVSSVMRFVLFDSIIARECHIRQSWARRQGPGWRYFVWKLVYVFISLAGIAVLLGIPLAYAFAKGWFRQPHEHLAPLVVGGIVIFLLFLAWLAAMGVIFVFTKDFVIPQMALENIDAFEGWRRLWAMIQADLGAYAAYIAMKVVLAIVVGILIAIAALIVGLFFAIPTVGLSMLAIVTGKSAGLTWNAYTITLAIVVGCILLGIFLYLVSLVSVPAIVFFPAYSMYFFAGRYPQLSIALSPGPAVPSPAGATPGLVPPSP